LTYRTKAVFEVEALGRQVTDPHLEREVLSVQFVSTINKRIEDQLTNSAPAMGRCNRNRCNVTTGFVQPDTAIANDWCSTGRCGGNQANALQQPQQERVIGCRGCAIGELRVGAGHDIPARLTVANLAAIGQG